MENLSECSISYNRSGRISRCCNQHGVCQQKAGCSHVHGSFVCVTVLGRDPSRCLSRTCRTGFLAIIGQLLQSQYRSWSSQFLHQSYSICYLFMHREVQLREQKITIVKNQLPFVRGLKSVVLNSGPSPPTAIVLSKVVIRRLNIQYSFQSSFSRLCLG